MRFSLSQLLLALLVTALALALYVNHTRSQRQIREYMAKADARESLEDDLEHALIDGLAPGDRLDENPYYRLLVDDVVTGDDPGFAYCANFIAEHADDAPSSFEGCEFHEFRFRDGPGFIAQYVVVARDNRCVLVFWAGGSMLPV